MSNGPRTTGGNGGGGGGGGLAQTTVVVNLGNFRPSRWSEGSCHLTEKEEAEENQLQEVIHKWLSPPDPSTNHNIVFGAHYKRPADWFVQGSTYREWKNQSGASLLWIHGRPGSGKSVYCFTIIEDLGAMCEAGQASMAYFYFDSKHDNTQYLHDLITSFLIQLSPYSHPHCNILSRLYEAHDSGKTQPSDLVLVRYLKHMLFSLPGRRPIYLVMGSLDECPDISGIPSARKRVLQLVKELVDLRLPNLHICVTSKPEFDIRDVLEPLTSFRVSLHDQGHIESEVWMV